MNAQDVAPRRPPTSSRRQRPSTLRVHGALFSVALLFSANYIISKFGMRALAPLSFAWLRVAGASVLLLLVSRGDTLPRGEWRRITLFSILGVVINQTLFLSGLAFTTVHVAAILITSIPVFVAAAAVVLGRERASAMRIGGIAVACTGALLVVGGEHIAGSGHEALGAAMILINCLSYALYLVVSKPDMGRLSPRAVVARMFAIGTVFMLPICAPALLRERWSAVSPTAWISLGLVILGPTFAAYLLQAWALEYADSSVVAAYTYVQPVLATLMAAVFFGEQIRAVVALAAVLIFAGVWIVTQSGRSSPPHSL
ncbi:MAG: EamA family transporter [Acidobacteriota bacterium]